MTHVRTSPYYPQSNGKFERWNHSFKSEGFRPGVPLTLEDGRRVAAQYVEYYNTVRLHSAVGDVTPQTRLEGRRQEILDARDRKLNTAAWVRCSAPVARCMARRSGRSSEL
jgi:putative transposase